MRRRVVNDENIQRVAVFRFGRRDEAPIVGIGGNQLLASERTEVGSIFLHGNSLLEQSLAVRINRFELIWRFQ